MRASRLALAVVFFVVWLVILLAGADRPPPPGFLWVVLLDAAAAGIVYWRTATYGDWCATGRRSRALRAVLEGCGVGIVVAGLLMLFNLGGEPGITPSWRDRSIWFAVLGAVGAVNALLVFGGSCMIRRLAARQRSSKATVQTAPNEARDRTRMTRIGRICADPIRGKLPNPRSIATG